MPDSATIDEDDLAAAELMLGVPTEAERAVLQARADRDPTFAARVERWNERLAPLFMEIAPVPAPAGSWDRIAARLPVDPAPVLQRRVRRWQWATGAATAVAAGLAVLLAIPTPPVVVERPAPVIVPQLAVAQLSDESGTPLLAVGIERRSGQVSVRLQDLPAAARVPELWIIPSGGTPRSLGLIRADGTIDVAIPHDLRASLGKDATLAVSMELPEGAPHAAPAGPVVATGAVVTL
ncbi:anti-sigma factor [Sphingomonas sp. CFBP 13720]|uniref:anti-sigma factor n=1 Tax=Sphingomonas sp. CFBP 13720 TaxID=2775302 RepID=UPI001784110C|nr:anti-sigma factor [Sphingomonas sp. CFBP 13720]MBD8677227.1 anti-sigma factor [Sphingomonas sp. CFBP 13720]